MRAPVIIIAAMTAAIALDPSPGSAQSHHDHPRLHVNPRWDECSFQLDPSLTQAAWRKFTKEAGVVTYFRPLRDARPMGARRFEISVIQAETAIDDADPAWNDTFVHPDSTHWLFDGSRLPIPGLLARAGVTDRIDVGVYLTKNPNANYGFVGGQVQYNALEDARTGIAAAARLSAVTMFGPEDLDFSVYGLDLVASREFPLHSSWLSIAPYAGISGYLSTAHEKTAAVALSDERVLGSQAMVGAVAQISVARVALELASGSVSSRSIRVGFAF